ncbi:rod shape-determining protein MreC [Clostridium sp. KNHs214]|uniref:rod shape-determining protein MreC n=1 Tax=Clostridium sp. KNHs214 TaxID=1540257 RepID=UPI0005566E09|nr:rod shape-determining protein MreC [Clostridium sp. KNHs214]
MKLFKKKLTVAIIVLSVAFLGLIGYSAKRQKISAIENGVGVTLNSVQKFIYDICYEVKNSISFLKNFSEVKEQNGKLEKENAELKDKLTKQSMMKDENERLKQMLNYKDQNLEYDHLGCSITGKSGSDYLNGFTINRGKKDGIEIRMAVVNSFGLVGQVTSVSDSWAVVQTIENENIAVGGYVVGTKENTGIVKGYKDKNNKLFARLHYLPMDSKVKVGDEVLTGLVDVSSKDVEPGVYPKGIRIGKIVSIETDKGKMMKNAVIKPYVDFDRLEELFILVPKVSRKVK